MNISFVVAPFYAGDRIFSLDDPVANRDGCQEPFARLRNVLREAGINLDTQDICPVSEADAVLFFNAPRRTNRDLAIARRRGLPVHVLAMESEYIHRQNGDFALLDTCDTVFTYRDDMGDGKLYFQFRFPQKLRTPLRSAWEGRRFACMLAGNKWSRHPTQLYGTRLEIINWYEKFGADRLDLYGPRWNRPVPRNLAARVAGRVPVLRDLLAPKIGIWRGTAVAKEQVISQHRFCYCYENFTGPSGWITEKIFDVMFAGAVPVYWGADSTHEMIPSDCYVDAREFPSVSELDRHLQGLDDRACAAYVDAAAAFLATPAALDFSIDSFVNVIAGRLIAAKG